MKLIILMLLAISCSSPKGAITEKAKDLEIYSAKPTGCHVVGRVVGIDKKGSTELATNHALNQAEKLKATGIVINQEVPNGSTRAVHATAYQCN